MRSRPRAAPQIVERYEAGDFDLESDGERWCYRRLFVGRPGCPPPDCQVWVLHRFRCDFVYVYAQVIVEYLGDVHTTTLHVDTPRTFALMAAGWLVIPVAKQMLIDDADGVAACVQEHRRARERLATEGLLQGVTLPPQPRRRVPLSTLRPLG